MTRMIKPTESVITYFTSCYRLEVAGYKHALSKTIQPADLKVVRFKTNAPLPNLIIQKRSSPNL